MSGARKSSRKQGKQVGEIREKNDERVIHELALEANSTNMEKLQASLDGINRQLSELRQEMKTDLKSLKEEITTQMENKLVEFKENFDRKFNKIDADMTEQNDKMKDALARTEEVEHWSTEVNLTLQDLLEEREYMLAKMDDIESRARRNNLRVYNMPEDVETASGSVLEFIDGWLRREVIDIDLSIQRAHRALAPKRNPDQPPRSIVINFQQFDVKEKVLSAAWGKKVVKVGENRIYFDHDYTEKVLNQRKTYAKIKSVLHAQKIKFNTPFTKLRVHWPTGKVVYHTAEEAARDMRKRGLEVGEAETGTDNTGGDGTGAGGGQATLTERLRATRLGAWQQVDGRKRRAVETGRRARGRLQRYQH